MGNGTSPQMWNIILVQSAQTDAGLSAQCVKVVTIKIPVNTKSIQGVPSLGDYSINIFIGIMSTRKMLSRMKLQNGLKLNVKERKYPL